MNISDVIKTIQFEPHLGGRAVISICGRPIKILMGNSLEGGRDNDINKSMSLFLQHSKDGHY